MQHVMIDLETMGNGSNAAIVTIAAVQFDLESGKVGAMFEDHVSLESCLTAGLQPTASTILWWMRQGAAARQELTGGQQRAEPLHVVLADFAGWLSGVHKDPIVWGNSARFDLGILDSAFKACNIPLPWSFWAERCVRTLSDLAPEVKKSTKFEGVAHHAIDDCHHQVRYCVATYRKLKGLPPVAVEKPLVPVTFASTDDDLPF